MSQPLIFISYSSTDENEKDQLLSHLKVLQHQGLVDLWSEDRIGVGEAWEAEIGQAIAQAKVAILLITANYLTSEFILGTQVPSLLQRQEDEGLVILPVIARACAWREVVWLTRLEIRPGDKQPIWLNDSSNVDVKLAAVAEEIAQIITGNYRNIKAEDDTQELRNRSRMLKKVKEFWIKGVLESSLRGVVLIDLGMEYRPEAVVYPWETILQRPEQPVTPIPPGTKMIELFEQQDRTLLILGAPGSGKTTMLLELARSLINRAEKNVKEPIPVVFNLSSWAGKRLPLMNWLIEELNLRYDVPRKIATAWVESDQILPLLDGLDEVRQEHRQNCVEAINIFHQEHGLVNIVVCSRIEDYEALTAKLKFQGAVMLRPLTWPQIEAYLERLGEKLAPVRNLVQRDKALQELARSPWAIYCWPWG